MEKHNTDLRCAGQKQKSKRAVHTKAATDFNTPFTISWKPAALWGNILYAWNEYTVLSQRH